jgi:hypothetical protein
LKQLEKLKKDEIMKREVIEKEKERLIKEHEDLLKTYYTKGYYQSVSNMGTNSGFK